MLYSTAIPPAKAAPNIPQAAVCRGTAAPLEVAVVAALDEDELELEPELEPWAPPVEVDSLALR